MDLENAEKQIKKADSLMDTGWDFFKKHWYKLLIILLIYGGYKFVMAVAEDLDEEEQLEMYDEEAGQEAWAEE